MVQIVPYKFWNSISMNQSDDSKSWIEVDLFRDEIIRCTDIDHDYVFVLVSTKGDLEDSRLISREEILSKTMEWNVPWIETSGKRIISI